MTVTEPISYPTADLPRLDPEPLLRRLRDEQPLVRVRLPYGEPTWLATRYEDVRTVLSDPRFSRALAVGRDEPRVRRYTGDGSTILSLDPPDHSRLRRLVSKAFTMRRVEDLRARAQEIADDLVDRVLAAGPPTDLVDDFALPLPITVICELLGVPVEDRQDFRVWSDAFLSTTRYTEQEVLDNVAAMRRYVAGLIVQRRVAAQDDLISGLVAARDEDDRLSEDELLSLIQAILIAGHETTATQIPNFVYVLLTHPAQLAELRSDLDLVPRAVEELMRYVPLGAGAGIARYAAEDVTLSGVTVHAGEPVVASLPSANRDPAIYPEPDRLDLHRQTPAPHVGFGYGPHHCLGASLARMELQVALRTLLTRLPELRFAGTDDDVTWKQGLSTRGPEHLQLTWD